MNNRHYLEQELQQLFQNDDDIYNFIANAALDGIWFWDIENPEHEWMNDQFWITLGYMPSQKKHLASEWQDIINPEDLQTALENFQLHCQNPDHPYDQLVRYTHADGSTVWVRCRGIAIRDKDGNAIRMLGAHTDVTALKHAELRYLESLKNIDRLYADTKLALEESEQIFNAMPDAVLQVDSLGNIVKVNEKASEMFGYTIKEFSSTHIDALVPKSTQHKHPQKMDQYFNSPKPKEMAERKKRLTALHKDGSEFPVNIRLSPIQTKYGTHVLAVVRDISKTEELQASLTESQTHNRELYEQSIRDNLTRAYNRMYFNEKALIELERARRLNAPVSLLMIDIDDFKKINDTYGHQVGDNVLIEVSQTINSTLRSYDIFARYGGEEFIVLMPETNLDESLRVANRIVLSVSQQVLGSDSLLEKSPTVSIGGIGVINELYDLDTMIKLADTELYKAKVNGKNQASFHELD